MEMTISSASASAYHHLPQSRTQIHRRRSTSPSLSLRSSFLSSTNLSATQVNSRASLVLLGPKKSKGLSCNCLFGLGVPELVVIAGVVALVFGPKKLPEVGRSIGKTVKSFQQAAKEFETELKKEPDSTAEAIQNITTVSEEEKDDLKVPSTKES